MSHFTDFVKGVTVEFAHIPDMLFSGFETKEGFNTALPEKALLDAIYLRKTVPFHDELELDGLNLDRLKEMSAAYPSTTRKLAAGIGADLRYALERMGLTYQKGHIFYMVCGGSKNIDELTSKSVRFRLRYLSDMKNGRTSPPFPAHRGCD